MANRLPIMSGVRPYMKGVATITPSGVVTAEARKAQMNASRLEKLCRRRMAKAITPSGNSCSISDAAA